MSDISKRCAQPCARHLMMGLCMPRMNHTQAAHLFSNRIIIITIWMFLSSNQHEKCCVHHGTCCWVGTPDSVVL